MIIDLGEIGKLFVKIGGVLILALGVLGALKYALYIILLYLFKGALDLLATLNPILAGIFSVLGNWITALGSVIFVALLILNIVLAYFGYRLLKTADEIPMPAVARDRRIVMLAILLALSLFTGSLFIAVATLLPIAGLIIAPVRPTQSLEQA